MEEENIMDYSNNIKKGDIFYVAYAKDYINGDDDTGRPAIIVSSDSLNLHSEYVKVVYLTTKQKKPMRLIHLYTVRSLQWLYARRLIQSRKAD